MQRWVGKVAVVTGASAGIGAAITLGLAKEGMIVVGVARRVERIQDLSKQLKNGKGAIHAVKFDVSDIDAIPALMNDIKKKYGGIDVLVNNAGVLRSEHKICESPIQDFKDLVNINLLSMAVFCRDAIKSMRERNFAGHIININSLTGHKVIINEHLTFNLYSATKHGVTALTETLRAEMSMLGTMIKISSLSPGVVATEIFDKGKMASLSGDNLKNMVSLESKDMADALLFVLSTPPTVVISEITIQHVKELV